MKNQKGFSLVELLVVVIIIAIIAAIAIPSLLASRRAANEAQAVSNLRTINSANQTYYATTGAQTDYGSLAELAAAGSDLIDDEWTEGVQRGTYTYSLTLGADDDGFCVTAQTNDTSSRSFAVSHPGVIYTIDGTTVPTCDADTGDITTGTVLGGAS